MFELIFASDIHMKLGSLNVLGKQKFHAILMLQESNKGNSFC
jgi:hypothetical protein